MHDYKISVKTSYIVVQHDYRIPDSEFFFFFFNRIICYWYSKEFSQTDGSFEFPGHTFLISFSEYCFVCLFDLVLYIPSKIFQLCRDGSSWVEPVLS